MQLSLLHPPQNFPVVPEVCQVTKTGVFLERVKASVNGDNWVSFKTGGHCLYSVSPEDSSTATKFSVNSKELICPITEQWSISGILAFQALPGEVMPSLSLDSLQMYIQQHCLATIGSLSIANSKRHYTTFH